MKNNKSNSRNEVDTTLGYLIINLIHQGVTLDELVQPTNNISNQKDRKETKTKITNIVLDYINQNPQYIYLINDNCNASKFLNFIGFDILNFDL